MQVCLFDIDGTLLASGGAGKAAMDAALASEFGIQEPIDQVQMSGRTDRAIARDQFRLHQIEESAKNWQRFIDAYLGHLPQMLAQRPGRVLPGIQALLLTLKQRGAATGLLTGNVARGAETKLRHFGIVEHFQFGAYGDDHFSRDEVAQRAWERILAVVGDHVTAENVWVIGDTPLDVQCARAIGARAVAVATGVHTVEQLRDSQPDLLFADLSDAAPLLRMMG